MTVDLETLKTDILGFLKETSFAVFHGYSSMSDHVSVYWDVERRPDYREFIHVAEKAGVRLLVFYHQQFSLRQIDELLDELGESDLPRDEKRSYENRIRDIQKFEGFTCGLELSFSLDGRVFLYQQQTDWFRNWEELLAEIEALAEDEEEGGTDAIGGYFSNN